DVRGRDPGWSRANISSGRADPRGSACEPRLRRRGDAPAKRPGAQHTIRARFAGPRKAPLWTFVRHRGELHAYRALPESLPNELIKLENSPPPAFRTGRVSRSCCCDSRPVRLYVLIGLYD